ncbi:hypothetical protein B7494_g1684 [Chlorociboria aeruginascens]|nr:hypothetical protein B7494_g1684 [Chlorociboria aeruginascens]
MESSDTISHKTDDLTILDVEPHEIETKTTTYDRFAESTVLERELKFRERAQALNAYQKAHQIHSYIVAQEP